MIITTQQLVDKSACRNQVRHFKRVFGAKVRVTKALCMEHANDFDFTWAGMHLLTPNQQHVWAPLYVRAHAVYRDAVRPHYDSRTVQQHYLALVTAKALAFWEGTKAKR